MDFDEQVLHSYGVTKITGKEFTYTWSIHNFVIFDCSGFINSPTFTTNVDEDLSWNLEIVKWSTTGLTVSLNSVSPVSKSKSICITIFLVDCDGKDIFIVQQSAYTDWIGRLDWGYPDALKFDYLYNEKNRLLVNGTLTIKCTIFYFEDLVQVPLSKFVPSNHSCNCNLKNLFETKKLSDVTLCVGTQKFETHKCILAAQSEVFSAMFEHNMKEKSSNTVEIDDIEPPIIHEMLHFIYCGKTDNFQDPSNLLIAADKYQIDELKSACEDQLINDLSTTNVGKTLILADIYKVDTLKKHTIQYIVSHLREINLEQFKNDVESYSPLLSDMLQAFM